MLKQLQSLISNEKYIITLLSNTSAFFNETLSNINWVGYYLYKDNHLILGPFQGKTACEIIPLNKGVCGKCAAEKQAILVEDVHKFPGHIACDSASNSELVLPIIIDNELFGLLDIDSPLIGRFNQCDVKQLQQCVKALEEKIKELQ